jgi:hypothetical protein
MAATEILGRSFSDALYERYCDFDSTFNDLKNGCDIVFFVGSSPKKTGRKKKKKTQVRLIQLNLISFFQNQVLF